VAGADGAVVFVHDFFDDGEAEAGAFGFVGDVGLEGVFVEVGKAGAVVFDVQGDLAVVLAGMPADLRGVLVLGGFYGVFHEVDEDLSQVHRVGADVAEGVVQVEGQVLFAVEFGDLSQERVELEILSSGFQGFRDLAKVGDDLLHGFDLVDDGAGRFGKDLLVVFVGEFVGKAFL